jgi:CTD kinase subunit beta
MYPPNTVALGCLYTASLLATLEPPPSPLAEAQSDSKVATILKGKGDWEMIYMAEAEDLEGWELLYLCFIPTNFLLPQRLRM